MQPTPIRTNNVKLFNSWGYIYDGLKEFDEGEKSVNIILKNILDIKGVIYTPINKNDLLIKYKLSQEDKIPPSRMSLVSSKIIISQYVSYEM